MFIIRDPYNGEYQVDGHYTGKFDLAEVLEAIENGEEGEEDPPLPDEEEEIKEEKW